MGNQQSIEDREVPEEHRREFDESMKALREEIGPQVRVNYAKRAAENRQRDAAEKRAREAATATEVQKAPQPKKPELVRSSKSDAAAKPAARQPFKVVDDDDDGDDGEPEPRHTPATASRASSTASDAQRTVTATHTDFFNKWQPRKQPIEESKTIPDNEQSSSEDDFTGCGNQVSTQEAYSQTPKAPASVAGAISKGKPAASNPAATAPWADPAHAPGSNKLTPPATSGAAQGQRIKPSNTTAPKVTTSEQHSNKKPKPPSDFYKGAQTSKQKPVELLSIDTSSKPTKPSKATGSANITKSSAFRRLPPPTTAPPAKRPATNAFADERRSSAPKAPKRSSAASPQWPDGDASSDGGVAKLPGTRKKSVSGARQVAEKEDVTSIDERPPGWYKSLKQTSTRNSDEAGADTLMGKLKADIKKCRTANGSALLHLFEGILEGLHRVAFERVSGQLLRNDRMLHNDDGLPQLFDKNHLGGVSYPWYIRADAEELYNKWARKIFETDLLRGILPGKPGTKKNNYEDKMTDKIDPEYEGRANPKFHGNGLLLNGQWWPSQLAAVRDGAHGATIAGISGTEGKGAYSCIMSGGHDYPDEDNGDKVLYCGTDSTDGSVTEPTRRMLENVENGKHVRLIRSHNLKSPFAPEIGFRYDGLYKVVSSQNLDGSNSSRQRHRFKLERLPGQAPMRGSGPEKRPTEQEMEAHRKDKRLRGYT